MKQGEIWLVNFEPQTGHEIKKPRPAVILSNDSTFSKLPFRVVVPLRDTKPHHSEIRFYIVLEPNSVNKLDKTSTADCSQVKSFDRERFLKRIGKVSLKEYEFLRDTVTFCIS